MKFAVKGIEMIGTNKNQAQRGETGLSAVLLAAVILVGIYFTFQYFKNRNNDVVIHVPKIEVH